MQADGQYMGLLSIHGYAMCQPMRKEATPAVTDKFLSQPYIGNGHRSR